MEIPVEDDPAALRTPLAARPGPARRRGAESLKRMLSAESAQVVFASATVQLSAVLTSFLRTVIVTERPAPGATLKLTTSLRAVPDGTGKLASTSFVVSPLQGIRNFVLPELL